MKEEAEIKRICNEVIERIRPDEAERARVKAVTERIIDMINQKALDQGIEAEIHGYVARRT